MCGLKNPYLSYYSQVNEANTSLCIRLRKYITSLSALPRAPPKYLIHQLRGKNEDKESVSGGIHGVEGMAVGFESI